MKRIITLDGGGIRGMYSLQILAKLEEYLREDLDKPDLVLADVVDLFAGTSTGAIIATALSWGMSVAEVERIYVEHGHEMFSPLPWWRRFTAKYRTENLCEVFRNQFYEDDADRTPALLGTKKLRTMLLVIMRNATTGSPWPVTNNPKAMYNSPERVNNNLQIPLWQLIRASTAAPTFFAPESIKFGGHDFLFVDGGITPYNNPSLIAILMATLPSYCLEWPATRHELHVISIGTGSKATKLPKKLPHQINLYDHLRFVPAALMNSIATEQDLLCRVMGDCLFGSPIDKELGNLQQPNMFKPAEQKFTYVRYDTRLDACEDPELLKAFAKAELDDVKTIPSLQKLGKMYAEQNVKREHLYPRVS
jgi:uncharacterized protein